MMGVSREQLELRDRVNETIEQSQEDVPVLEVD
jgi:hypothetical protein